jgi:hypothetical protein
MSEFKIIRQFGKNTFKRTWALDSQLAFSEAALED